MSGMVADWRRTALFDLEGAKERMRKDVYALRARRRLDTLDRLLEDVNPEDFPTGFLVALLYVTAPAEEQLNNRPALLRATWERLVATSGRRGASWELAGLR